MWSSLKRLWRGAEAPSPAVVRRPYLQTEVSAICKMYEDGVSVDEIAERFDRTPPSIRQKVHLLKVRRSPAYLSEIRRASRRAG
jgi:hypothetical protein